MTVQPAFDHGRALAQLARAVPFAVDGGQLAELVDGCALFELEHEGRTVGAFAFDVQEDGDGRVIHCTAAGGEPGFDLAGEMVAFADSEAARIGAHAVVVQTRRRGLVRRLQRAGFHQVAGFTLRKDFRGLSQQ